MKPSTPTLKWAAGGLLAIGLVSRLFGILREIMLANYFGLGADLDAVFLGLAVPMALALGIAGGLSRVTVPVAAKLGGERFRGLYRGGSWRLLRILGPLSLGFAITSPLWARLLVMGDSETPLDILTKTCAVGSLALVFGGLAGFLKGLANARGRHVSGSMNVLFYNVFVCAAIYYFHESLGVLCVVVGIVLAEAMQIAILWLVLIPELAGKACFEKVDWDSLWTMLVPTIAVGMLQGVNVAIDRVFASRLESGSIAALAYGDKLVSIPVSLLGVAITTPLFTRLSRYAGDGREQAFSRTLLLGLRVLILVGTPVGFAIAVTAPPTISLLLERGAFGNEGVALTTRAMAGYALGVPYQIMFILLFSACLSRSRQWGIVILLACTSILNAVLDWAVVDVAGIVGIAAVTSLVALVRVLALVSLVQPTLVSSRELWMTGIRAHILGGLAAAAILGVGLSTGLLNAESRAIQVGMLVLAVVLFLGCATILWKPLLRDEWRSLARLRSAVARDAALTGKNAR